MALDESWSVWWGCLQCYNEGTLYGKWIELTKDGDRQSWSKQLREFEEQHQARMFAEDAGYYGIHEEWMALDNGVGADSEYIDTIYEILERRQRETQAVG